VRFRRDLIDIAMVERWLRLKRETEETDLSLDGMIAAYGLKPHYRHNAAADAFFAAQIFQIQMREMTVRGIDSTTRSLRPQIAAGMLNQGWPSNRYVIFTPHSIITQPDCESAIIMQQLIYTTN